MSAAVASALLIDDAIRKPLTALARSQKAPHRLVVRARIVLAAADGVSNAVIARMLSLSEDTVRTWRGRFIDGGIAGLADRRRPGRPPRYGPEVHLRIVATVTGERPEAGSVQPHRLIAEHLADVGISASQIGRILADLDLKPHRVRGWLTRPDAEPTSTPRPSPHNDGRQLAFVPGVRQTAEAVRPSSMPGGTRNATRWSAA
jgi:transposase